jgi:hypothetical protein
MNLITATEIKYACDVEKQNKVQMLVEFNNHHVTERHWITMIQEDDEEKLMDEKVF